MAVLEAIRKYQIDARGLYMRLIKEGGGFSIDWLHSNPFSVSLKRQLWVEFKDGVVKANFIVEREGLYGDLEEDEREISIPAADLLDHSSGGEMWKTRVREMLISRLERDIADLEKTLADRRLALDRLS